MAYASQNITVKEALILTDSLGSTFGKLFKADVLAIPGLKIEELAENFETLDYSQYRCILLLVGTNNLTPKHIWNWYRQRVRNKQPCSPLPPHLITPIPDFIALYRQLINKIQSVKPNVTIIVSAILPRKFDFTENSEHIYSINHYLEALCGTFFKCKYIPTYKVITKTREGILKDNIYSDDGLHLSDHGKTLVRAYFREQISLSLKSQ